jgi:anaerobic selenocysteine-containing dehydrogenase
MSAGETTTERDVIKKWIEERNGHPAVVRATEDDRKSGGLLRVEFRDPEDKLREIDWDEFFEVFEENKLAFLHQDKTADGKTGRFNKFINREG